MNARSVLAMLGSFAAFGLLACDVKPPALYGEEPPDPNNPGNKEPPPPPPPDMAMSPYPQGPYGNQPGEVMFDIDLPGYRMSLDNTDSSTVPFEDSLTLASVRSRSKAKCIWLCVGAVW